MNGFRHLPRLRRTAEERRLQGRPRNGERPVPAMRPVMGGDLRSAGNAALYRLITARQQAEVDRTEPVRDEALSRMAAEAVPTQAIAVRPTEALATVEEPALAKETPGPAAEQSPLAVAGASDGSLAPASEETERTAPAPTEARAPMPVAKEPRMREDLDALASALRSTLATPIGRALRGSMRKLVLRQQGLGLDALIVGDALTFVTPSSAHGSQVKEIPLADGVTLILDLRDQTATDLPLPVKHLLDRASPSGQPMSTSPISSAEETQLDRFAASADRLLAGAARSSHAGIVHEGTVVGRPERVRVSAFAASAGIGGLAALAGGLFGPLGAGVGALVGAGAAALIGFFLRRRRG